MILHLSVLRKAVMMMRSLTRMKLINWHYFQNETIDFHGSTLITGDNGAGKSTLIDALQVVIIANLKRIRFNSSAFEEKTTRDLKSYLRGKTGTEGGQNYLRNDDFSSYIILEINHTKTRKSYQIGVAFDYSAARGEEEHTFFRIDEQEISDDLYFAEPGLTRNRQEFFHFLKTRGIKHRQYRNDVGGYLHDLRQLFGSVKESFFPLFQKGISFSPITDLRSFVYGYILEERHVDVDTMRDYFEKFRQVEQMIADTEVEIAALEKIAAGYAEIEKVRDQQKISRYMYLRAQLEEKRQEAVRLEEKQTNEKKALERLHAELEACKDQKSDLDTQKEDLETAIAENQVTVREKMLEAKMKALDDKLSELKAIRKNLLNMIRVEVREYHDLAEVLRRVDAPFSLSTNLRDGLALWQQVCDDNAASFPDSASDMAAAWGEAMGWLTLEKEKWRQEKEQLEQEETTAQKTIRELEKNQILRSDSPTMKLKKILEDHLAGSDGPVPVHIFCEAVEIRDKTWQNAIEGYLHTQKFDLLVPPGYFDEALALYERHKFSHNIENVGLVNTEKLMAKARKRLTSSLAEEVTARQDYIAAYADWLLGGIIKCGSEKELKLHARSITPGCMLYQNHTARQIPARRYEVPYIGKDAVTFQLERARKQLEECRDKLRSLTAKLAACDGIDTLSRDKNDRYAGWQKEYKQLQSEEALEEQLVSLQREHMLLDRSELNKLLQKKQDVKDKLSALDKQILKLTGDIRETGVSLNQLTADLERAAEEITAAEAEYNTHVGSMPLEMSEQGGKKWSKEAEKKSPDTLKNNYAGSMAGLATKIENMMRELIRIRTNFVHEFNFSGDSGAADNEDFEKRLTLLKDSHLQDYKEKAREAKEQAEKAFQEHFIAKLRESIELAREEIHELNRALKDLKFGSDSYRFSLTPKNETKAYYNMIMDSQISTGASLFNNVFMEEHGEAIASFFREISRQDEEFQKKMQLLTDYRTYLDFEIIITDDLGNKSYFSRVARDKSGGETQVPFYVAILASFYQAYQMYRNHDTLRLVVFDEAFNRMDADRIEEAVRFINTLGFQSLIVAPTGKIQLIVPHVNTNLIIMKDGFDSYVERVSRKEIEAWN
ncbi:ATP-binding protein [Dethiobacter alkaliphilus]|uniref:ATP-binding protein n=1 Tax=Dethiobacter alkaliphilus TaxID=427926 RepID=UPI002228047F|nr:SbcC/MukB-like Walker B domain-containing protein [Dethiobacter alkaliphilus]MCW3490210.1 AAA family ATPase [Dethiobacter alkaliphilus]